MKRQSKKVFSSKIEEYADLFDRYIDGEYNITNQDTINMLRYLWVYWNFKKTKDELINCKYIKE